MFSHAIHLPPAFMEIHSFVVDMCHVFMDTSFPPGNPAFVTETYFCMGSHHNCYGNPSLFHGNLGFLQSLVHAQLILLAFM